jgi:D-glycero-D-manno-heptose 1,7-bisphosphate phosphatase
MSTSQRGLILDRDGVVNRDTGYLHRQEDCQFIDGIFAMAASFAAAQFAVVIATNQSGIARGYYTEDDFRCLMEWMRGEFGRHGVTLAGIYHCPYHPTEGIGAYRRDSDCRKPRPGMLLRAAADLGLDLAASWCVGDAMSDIEAGRAARVGTLVLLDPVGPAVTRASDHWVVPDLAAVTALLHRARTDSSAGAAGED